jgi:hypothetical protein
MKRLYMSTPETPELYPAAKFLIDPYDDSPELMKFTEEKIQDIKEQRDAQFLMNKYHS